MHEHTGGRPTAAPAVLLKMDLWALLEHTSERDRGVVWVLGGGGWLGVGKRVHANECEFVGCALTFAIGTHISWVNVYMRPECAT